MLGCYIYSFKFTMFLCLLFFGLAFLSNPTHTCFVHVYAGQILHTQASICLRRPLSRNLNLCFVLFTLFVPCVKLLFCSSLHMYIAWVSVSHVCLFAFHMLRLGLAFFSLSNAMNTHSHVHAYGHRCWVIAR